MNHVSPRQAVGVWLFLVTATLCSGWLAEHHGFAGRWTAVAVMFVAALKGRAVILYFMELKVAPRAWRIAFEVWMWLCAGLIVALWASSSGVA
ncbi:MAG: cytochrome C oxidase subunit IV family protein [Rhodocyclaceae bacterium]|jgi:apolipoprotein N-acyltransferase|nr:cytochrome C oxidase subunit IV family protein [Rhodocyclaceae bacterium]